MKRNLTFKSIFWHISLLIITLPGIPVSGQQIGSAPVITLVNPSSLDSLNNSGICLVRAEILSSSTLSTIRILNNGKKAVSESGINPVKKDNNIYIIESLVPLTRGSNLIYVEAKNSSGSASSEKRSVTCQPEPFITWLLPASVSTNTESEVFTIKAVIKTDLDPMSININLNGTAIAQEVKGMTRTNNNSFSLESNIQLKPGKNSVYIVASNIKGVTNSTTRIITKTAGSAPMITLNNPTTGDSLNNSGLALVRASIFSKSSLKTVIIVDNNEPIANSEMGLKPIQKDSVTYLIESLIPLKGGLNNIYIEAKNSFGTSVSAKRSITCQPEPFITWLWPATATSTTESEMMTIKALIKTDIDLKNISLNLNGIVLTQATEDIPRLNNNTFSIERSIQIKPGKNSVYITASNIKGSATSSTRIINKSAGSAAVITLTSPSGGDTLNNSGLALIRANIISKSSLLTIRIFNNDEPISNNEAAIKPVQKDSVTYLIENFVPLKGGLNNIYLEVKNSIGTSISEKRTIICQPQPFISWVMPAYGNSNAESEMVIVKAEIKTDLDLKNISLNLNGISLAQGPEAITRLNKNTYILERRIQLKSGKNTIFITANNIKGETNSTIRIVSNSVGSPPVISIISPSFIDSLNNSGIVLVNAEISSKSELQTFRIFNNKKLVVSGTAEILEHKDSITYVLKNLVPLQTGVNTIYVEAKNSIGSVSSEKRSITCQLEPIINWILPASTNSSMGSGKLNIKAEILTTFDLLSTSINLNGNVIAQDNTGITRLSNNTYSFEKTVSLDAGSNSIILVVSNAKGTAYSAKRSISYVPGVISEIKWIDPVSPNTNTFNPDFRISANIKSKSEIKISHLYLNGMELPPGPKPTISKKNAQEYIYENAITLKPGENTIDLSVLSDEGIISSERRSVTYSVPALPVLTWSIPKSDQPGINTSSLDIELNIKSSVSLEKVALYLNGKMVDDENSLNSVKKENEIFILRKTLALSPGDNKIYVMAGNIAGTATSETRNIKYTIPSMPVFTWKYPESGNSSLSSESLNIKVNITSTTDLRNLKVFHNEKALPGDPKINVINREKGDYQIETTITLSQGENKIYLAAENSAGNSISETRSIKYLTPVAPSVTWISPSRPTNTINLNSAKIKATIKSIDKLQSLLVYANGVASDELNQISSAGTEGEYLLEKTINLQPGENNIYIVVTNNNGATKSEPRFLTNPPANPPVITWTSPVDPNAIVNSEVVVIEACIKSATELKSAQIFVNGVQQDNEMMFQTAPEAECNYRLTKPLILREGDNSVFIIATNFAGSINSDKRMIRFEKSALVEKRLALVIGNSDYGSSNVLKNLVNDANLIEGTLKTLGFNVTKLINASKTQMYEALRDFSKRLTEYNVALFYYAGHGVQVDGQNYLVPVDATLNEPSDCKWEAMRVNDVVEEFEKVPENINIVILDACRNNPFRSWSRGGGQGFRTINSVSGTIISFATAEGSTAADGSGYNGVFTEELVTQMNIPQSLSSVFNNTRKQVMKKTNNLQRPLEMNGLTGDFYFKK